MHGNNICTVKFFSVVFVSLCWMTSCSEVLVQKNLETKLPNNQNGLWNEKSQGSMALKLSLCNGVLHTSTSSSAHIEIASSKMNYSNIQDKNRKIEKSTSMLEVLLLLAIICRMKKSGESES